MSKENHVPYFVTTPPPNFRKKNVNTMKIGMNTNTPAYNAKSISQYNVDGSLSRNPNIRTNDNARTPIGGSYVGNSSSVRSAITPSQNDNDRSAMGIKQPMNIVSPVGYNSYEVKNERMQSPQQSLNKSLEQNQQARMSTGQMNTSRSTMQSSRPMDVTPRYKAVPSITNPEQRFRTPPASMNQQPIRPATGQKTSSQAKLQYDSSSSVSSRPSTSGMQNARYYSMGMPPPTSPSNYMPGQYVKPGVQATHSSPLGSDHNLLSYGSASSEHTMSSHASTSSATERRISPYLNASSELKEAAYARPAPIDHRMQMYYDNQASYYSRSYTNGAVYYPSPAMTYSNVPPPSAPPTHYQQPIHSTPPAPQPYTAMYQTAVPGPSGYLPRPNYYKRRLDSDSDSQRKNNKKRKKPLSQNISHRKDWSVSDAKKAIEVEKECNKRARSQSLIIKFPDLELNRDIVSQFHRSIEGVHFQQPSTPRFCFVTLASTADPEDVIKELNRVKFGHGYLTAEFKKDREDELNLGPEDIDPLTLYVGNLAQEVTKDDMVRTFPKSKRIDIGYAKKMKYTRYAFVSFKSVDDAIKAFKRTHSTQMHSKSLIVRFRRLHGTVGMPGEPKPQQPQKPLENQTRTNSLSEEAEESEEVQPAPWDMVDVSSWEPDARDRIKREPMEILSDDEEPLEEIGEDDNDNDMDEVQEVKPKLEVASPFLPGSLEVAFSMHKPLQVNNMKQEIVVEDSSSESNPVVVSQQNSDPDKRLNNYNHVGSPPDIKPSLPIIPDESTLNNTQNCTPSLANATSIEKHIGYCENDNLATVEGSVSQQKSGTELVPVPMPMIDRKPVIDPVSGAVIQTKRDISEPTSTSDQLPMIDRKPVIDPVSGAVIQTKRAISEPTTTYDQLISLEHRVRNTYHPIEQVKEEFPEEAKKSESQTDCSRLEQTTNLNKDKRNEEVVEKIPVELSQCNQADTTVTDNNTNQTLDVEFVVETPGFSDKVRTSLRIKDEPSEDDYIRKRSAILDEVDVRREVKDEPNDDDDDDADDSDDSDDRMDFDRIILKMNQNRTKAD